MSQFRDSLAADVTVGFDSAHNQEPIEIAVADAILRSPEMQAIKVSLFRLSTSQTPSIDPEYWRGIRLRRSGLPQHVADWVLS